MVGWVYGISTFIGYLMTNSVYIYIYIYIYINIYKCVCVSISIVFLYTHLNVKTVLFQRFSLAQVLFKCQSNSISSNSV